MDAVVHSIDGVPIRLGSERWMPIVEHHDDLAVPHLLKLPSKQVWFDFDEEADVLYVTFERPQGATDSELTEDGVLMRYRGEHLVGVTILNVRKRVSGGL